VPTLPFIDFKHNYLKNKLALSTVSGRLLTLIAVCYYALRPTGIALPEQVDASHNSRAAIMDGRFIDNLPAKMFF
jgi:hypothetical protein